jgi:queuine/archaeosine tRNA-ribosyltransferase
MGRLRNGDRSRASLSDQQSDVRGILLLLMSVRTSLERHKADNACLRIMDDCIAAFQTRYKIGEREMREAIVWEETSLEALVRLLEYLHGEVNDRLRDRQCAERLQTCIDYMSEIKPS